jgi:hypothetical protein
MLLNKVSVLDKGFVAPLCFSGNGRLLQEIQDEYFKTRANLKLLDISSASLIIKCPLFVQLNLSQYGFNIIATPSNNVEAYIPDVSMIEGESIEDKNEIHRYISMTTEALILNHTGIKMDGASSFTSQLLTPITVYNEIIVSGNIKKWSEYVRQKNLPKEIELYRSNIEFLLTQEWKNIRSF